MKMRVTKKERSRSGAHPCKHSHYNHYTYSSRSRPSAHCPPSSLLSTFTFLSFFFNLILLTIIYDVKLFYLNGRLR